VAKVCPLTHGFLIPMTQRILSVICPKNFDENCSSGSEGKRSNPYFFFFFPSPHPRNRSITDRFIKRFLRHDHLDKGWSIHRFLRHRFFKTIRIRCYYHHDHHHGVCCTALSSLSLSSLSLCRLIRQHPVAEIHPRLQYSRRLSSKMRIVLLLLFLLSHHHHFLFHSFEGTWMMMGTQNLLLFLLQ